MGEGGRDDSARGRGGHGEPVKVPLRDGGGGGGALDAGGDGERPEVDEAEEGAEPPGAEVEDEEVLAASAADGREMAAEEDAREHGEPDPGPQDDKGEGGEAEEDEDGAGSEDAAGEFERFDGAVERMARAVDGECPDDGEDGGEKGEPAHYFVLDAGAVPYALVA